MTRHPIGLVPRRYRSNLNFWRKYLGDTKMSYPARQQLDSLSHDRYSRFERHQLFILWDFMKRLELNG